MNELDLRAYYSSLAPDSDSEDRVLAALAADPARRNVRAGLVLTGSVAAVGAVALAASLLAHRGNSPVRAGSPPTVVPAAPTATAATGAPVEITPQVLVQTLTGLFTGRGTVSAPAGRSVDNQVLADLVYDDGHGAARIDVAVSWPGSAPHDYQPLGCGTASPSCIVLPGGTQVGVSQGLERQDQPTTSSTAWAVQAVRTDGFEVDITEWNAAMEKDSPVTRPEPPFTVAQLTAFATSTQWSRTVSAARAAAAARLFTPDPAPAQSTAATITATQTPSS